MNVQEVYKDSFLVKIDKHAYEKLQDIYYFETIGKKKILENIDESIKAIIDNTNIENMYVIDSKNGYMIKYEVNHFKYEIWCYTLSEVIIHLKNFIKH